MKLNLVIISSLALLILFWLFLKGEPKTDIIKTFDRTGIDLLVTVHVYPTQKDMIRSLELLLSSEINPGTMGMAVYSPDDYRCDIFITEPRRVEGETTKTLGHEMLHCLYGEVHN